MAGGKNMIISAVHHIQITIPTGAEDEARAFYCGILGLSEIEKPDSLKPRGGFWVQLGNQQVHISIEDGVDRRATKAHIAYQVSDIGGWRALLQSKGVEIGDSVPIPGYERFEFRDPFGNRVEFIQPLA
jgi:catechol 2,3-dioxygenase-like lactoylglutathione lyase family enzyme